MNRVPSLLVGAGIRMRTATGADAPFILALRRDPFKGRHLAPTVSDLAAQRGWMERMELMPDHRYFIIENDDDAERLGTLRLSISADEHFGADSLILATGAPPGAAVEVARIVYGFALSLGLSGGRFGTRTDNWRARRFFDRIGAVQVADDGVDCRYEVTREIMNRFLSEGVAGME